MTERLSLSLSIYTIKLEVINSTLCCGASTVKTLSFACLDDGSMTQKSISWFVRETQVERHNWNSFVVLFSACSHKLEIPFQNCISLLFSTILTFNNFSTRLKKSIRTSQKPQPHFSPTHKARARHAVYQENAVKDEVLKMPSRRLTSQVSRHHRRFNSTCVRSADSKSARIPNLLLHFLGQFSKANECQGARGCTVFSTMSRPRGESGDAGS